MRVAGHVELARHVAVLHEGVVESLTAPAEELGVVRLAGAHRPSKAGPEEAGVVRATIHVT